jgi:hypothetical protein
VNLRFLCNWRPYRDGQCLEIPDNIGGHFVGRGMAEVVTAADVREYERPPRSAFEALDKAEITRAVIAALNKKPARAGRGRREDECEFDPDELDRELGGSAYEFLFGGESSVTSSLEHRG